MTTSRIRDLGSHHEKGPISGFFWICVHDIHAVVAIIFVVGHLRRHDLRCRRHCRRFNLLRRCHYRRCCSHLRCCRHRHHNVRRRRSLRCRGHLRRNNLRRLRRHRCRLFNFL